MSAKRSKQIRRFERRLDRLESENERLKKLAMDRYVDFCEFKHNAMNKISEVDVRLSQHVYDSQSSKKHFRAFAYGVLVAVAVLITAFLLNGGV